MAEKLFHDLVTLFVVVNPIGVVPLFLAVAGHENAATRRRIAGQAILISVAARHSGADRRGRPDPHHTCRGGEDSRAGCPVMPTVAPGRYKEAEPAR
jgi:hypothetical protein